MYDTADKFCRMRRLDPEYAGRGWMYREHLRDNIKLYAENNPHFAELCGSSDREHQLVMFFRDIALENKPPEDWEPPNRKELALEHLTSYLEASCESAAQQVREIYRGSWQEYWSIARAALYDRSQLEKFLANYNPQGGATLHTYVQRALVNIIKGEKQVGRFSRWRLLELSSNKKLTEALLRAGYREPDIAKFLFARKYFKMVYLLKRVENPNRKKGQKWPDPHQQDFQEAAQLYNNEMWLPPAPHEVAFGSPIAGERVEQWMENCIKALEESQYPSRTVFQAETPAAEEAILSEDTYDKFQREMRSWPNIEEKRIGNRLWLIDREGILPLYYGLGLKQREIEELYGIRQSTVSRRIEKYTKKLISLLGRESKAETWVSEFVSHWLDKNCQSPNKSDCIEAALVVAVKKLAASQRKLLILYYGSSSLSKRQIAEKLHLSPEEVKARLREAENRLERHLMAAIADWIEDVVKRFFFLYYQGKVRAYLGQDLRNDTIDRGDS